MQSDDTEDLQRRQHQELGDFQNPNLVNQLSSLKHASVGQFLPTVNGGTPILDSTQMSIFGNIETMPSELVLTHHQNPDSVNPVVLLPPQYDMSSHGNRATNGGKNFNQFSQGPSNLSVDMRIKNHNNLGVAAVQPSPFGSSFMNQQFNFPLDQSRFPDGQGPIEGINGESLSRDYSRQGIPMQGNASFLESGGGHQDSDWEGFSPGQSSNPGSASLDPLEQKILYGTDDNIWVSSLSRSSKTSTGGFQTAVEHVSNMDALPSLQSGSWSALMLSAVEETSSRDTVMQEEWSGLSFKNPGSINGTQPLNSIEGKKLQKNWVDGNLQNAFPPSSEGPKHLLQNLNMNHSFLKFQESGHQYGSSHATLEQFPGNSGQLIDYSSRKQLPTRETPIHAPVLSTESPDSGFRLQATYRQAPQAHSFFTTLGSSSATFLPGNCSNDTGNQHPVLPVPSSTGIHFPACSAGATQHAGLPTPWPDISTRQDASAHRPHKFSNLFGFPNPASSSLEATEHPNQKSFQHEQESSPNIRRLEGFGQPLNQGNSLAESSSDINNSISLGSTNTQEYEKNHHMEAGAIVLNSLDWQLSNHAEGGDHKVPPADIVAFGNSLSQNYSLVHHVNSSRNIEADVGKSSPSKYNNVNHEKSNANAMEHFMSGQKPGVKDIAKGDPHPVPQLGATFSGNIKGLKFLQDTQINDSGRSSLTASHQKQEDMFGQRDTPARSIGSIEAVSNSAYPSQVSQQMAPSWTKLYGTLKAGNMPPLCEPTPAISADPLFSEVQQNSLNMQANQGSGYFPSTAATSILCKQLDSPSMVAPDLMASQKLAVSVPKERKFAEFSMVPWHNEMEREPLGLCDISTAELVWAQTLNRRSMQVKDEADVEEFIPSVRAKRRLICNTHLMQQVFGAMPAVILRCDASLSCVVVPYLASRLTLGDACNLTSQLSNHTNDNSSTDKQRNSRKRKAREFSKVIEGFISQTQKLKGDLFSVPKMPSYTAMKVEAQELEKFSIINRFAKIHIKAVGHAASSPAAPKTNILRYVVAVPMPSSVPEGVDCISL